MLSTTTVAAATLCTVVAYRAINPSSEYSKERVLWLTVLKQAIMDSEGRGEVEPYLIYRAKKWMTKMTHSFLTVCSLAGMPSTQAYFLQEQQRLKWRKQ